ncbi:hypothetical protein EIN_326230 [Entamoeba invadens IP1]|nr:hypothetical protein EIN_326230 [Entamoeba invadens IP1]ELP87562.1 hypothetical protein EIN_326230 [Entamoeba invadens IP1]|eukprot:XP_004254333.1 hypothetical protein EIN_326230 [Entamoeba invadens IP1]
MTVSSYKNLGFTRAVKMNLRRQFNVTKGKCFRLCLNPFDSENQSDLFHVVPSSNGQPKYYPRFDFAKVECISINISPKQNSFDDSLSSYAIFYCIDSGIGESRFVSTTIEETESDYEMVKAYISNKDVREVNDDKKMTFNIKTIRFITSDDVTTIHIGNGFNIKEMCSGTVHDNGSYYSGLYDPKNGNQVLHPYGQEGQNEQEEHNGQYGMDIENDTILQKIICFGMVYMVFPPDHATNYTIDVVYKMKLYS